MLGEELMRKVKNRNILISTGKTGGHIIPALSVGRNYIIEFDEVKVIYASIEDSHIFKDFLKKGENLNFIFLKDWQGFNVKVLYENVFEIFKALKKFNVKKVLIFGSYLSLPVIIASLLNGSKIYIHEQNVLPGRANKLASIFSKKIFISYAKTAKYFPSFLRRKIVLTGNPVRNYNFKDLEEKNQILFLGGSQGAMTINKFIVDNIEKIEALPSINFVVITGKRNYGDVLGELKGNVPKNLRLLPFEYEILDLMFESKLIVSRAGAVTLSEIAYIKKPSVLVPFPFARDNHQYINAKYFEEKGAAILINNDELKDSFDLIIKIFNSPERLNEMKYALNDLFIPEAERRIVKNLC